MQFLEGLLTKGGLPFPTILELANRSEPPVTVASLKRAKSQLGVLSWKKPAGILSKPCNYWYLAEALNDQDLSLFASANNSPVEVMSIFERAARESAGGNFWRGTAASAAQPVSFGAPIDPLAPLAPVDPLAPVAQLKWDAHLESALRIAIEEARNRLASLRTRPRQELIPSNPL